MVIPFFLRFGTALLVIRPVRSRRPRRRLGGFGLGLDASGGLLVRDLRDGCRGVVARCGCSFLDPGRSLGGLVDRLGRGAATAPPLLSSRAERP